MRRLFLTTTAFSVALTGGPLPVTAQTVLQIEGREVICLPNRQTECPEGAFCVVARRQKNCEARALEALGLAQGGAEGEAAAEAEAGAAEAEAAAAEEAAQAAAEAEAAAAEEAAQAAEAEAAAAEEAAQAAAEAEAAAVEEAAQAAEAEAEEAAQAAAEAEAAAAEEAAQAAAEAEAAAAEEAAQAAAEDSGPVVESDPITEGELAEIIETAEGVEAPGVEAVEALTDILAEEASDAVGAEEPMPAAAIAEEEGPAVIIEGATGGEGPAVVTEGAEPGTPRKPRRPRVVVEEVTEDDIRSSDEDFAEGAIAPEVRRNDDGDKELSDLEKFGLVVVGALVVGAILKNGDQVVSNTGDRVVVRRDDGQYVVLKDDDTLIRRPGSTVQTETYEDGSTRSTVLYSDGSRIVTIRDASGRVLRRARIDANGRETLLINDLAPVEEIDVRRLPKPEQGRVIGAGADDAELQAAMLALEARDIGRSFSLRQIREYPEVRALAPTIDVQSITFETGSAAIRGSEARKLQELGRLMTRLVEENPAEMFLIEGHTDAVGSGAYNLALSDRRAESLALALTEYFDVPPENMVIQGYGETELMIPTDGDEPLNRRAAVRIITPLLVEFAER